MKHEADVVSLDEFRAARQPKPLPVNHLPSTAEECLRMSQTCVAFLPPEWMAEYAANTTAVGATLGTIEGPALPWEAL